MAHAVAAVLVVHAECESVGAQRFDDRIARLQRRAELSALPLLFPPAPKRQ